jgi:hypothetical protein
MHIRRRPIAAFPLLFAALTCGAAPTVAHDEYRYVGTISRIDAKVTRLTVKWTKNSKPETATVAITEATSVTRNGTGVRRSELKAGVSVVVLAIWDPDRPLEVPEATDIMLVPPINPKSEAPDW